MVYDTPAIAALAMALVLASILGVIAHRLKLPPLPAYLLAGLLVGPQVLDLAGSPALGGQLAEFGIILLMFGVGLHVSLRDLLAIRPLALVGSLAQLVLGSLLGLALALLLGWSMSAGLLFGLALSVASSVLVRQTAADGHRQLSRREDNAIGWLVVQNLVAVLALLLLPTLAGLEGTAAIYDPFVSLVERLLGSPVAMGGVLALTLLKLAAFIGFMLVAGHSVIPWLLHAIARLGSRELFRLAIIAIALLLALGAAWLFGVSLALGAFLAGMILNSSGSLGRAARQTLPLRDAFAVLFFIAVGMLFDPSLFLTQPLPLLATLLIVMLGKSLAAFAAMLLFRRSVADALGLSARLAQIGEFSFILVSAGVALALLPPEALGLVLAGMLVSILFNPLLFWGAARLQPRIEARMGAEPGQRVEPVDSALPPEPRLPPTDNLLDQAVILPTAAVAVAATPVEPAIVTEPTDAEPPAAPEPELPEAAPPADAVIVLPSPEAEAEAVADEAPALDESPATLDAAVPPPAESEASEPASEPETPEPAAEVEAPAEPESVATENDGAPTEEKPDILPPPIPTVAPEPKS